MCPLLPCLPCSPCKACPQRRLWPILPTCTMPEAGYLVEQVVVGLIFIPIAGLCLRQLFQDCKVHGCLSGKTAQKRAKVRKEEPYTRRAAIRLMCCCTILMFIVQLDLFGFNGLIPHSVSQIFRGIIIIQVFAGTQYQIIGYVGVIYATRLGATPPNLERAILWSNAVICALIFTSGIIAIVENKAPYFAFTFFFAAFQSTFILCFTSVVFFRMRRLLIAHMGRLRAKVSVNPLRKVMRKTTALHALASFGYTVAAGEKNDEATF